VCAALTLGNQYISEGPLWTDTRMILPVSARHGKQ